MQGLLRVDRPVLAPTPLAPCMLRNTRTTRTNRIDRMLRGMHLDVALGMGLDIATGVGMVRDTGVGPDAYLHPVAYRNSSTEAKSPAKSGFSKFSTIFPSEACQKNDVMGMINYFDTTHAPRCSATQPPPTRNSGRKSFPSSEP